MENEQHTSAEEVNAEGGWLITHHTKTWDTRVRLDSIEGQVAEKAAALAKAQAEYDEVSVKVATYQTEITAANVLKMSETLPVSEPVTATTTPIT